MDTFFRNLLNAPKPDDKFPAPTKEYLERSFRIRFDDGKPVFEEAD